MGTKEWLNRGREADKYINELLKEKEEALTRATSVTAVSDSERVQSSKGNSTERKFIAYAEYDRLIDKHIDELWEIKTEIMQALGAVKDTTLRRLLFNRYIRCMKWESVAEDMGYDVRHILRLHGKALKKIGEVIPPRCMP